MKALDLFSGIGGIKKGAELAGIYDVVSNERDDKCGITYIYNFGNKNLQLCDIYDLDMSKITCDVLFAGFPCQPFSIAGYRKGFEDSGRGDLFFKIIEILEDKKPIMFLLENVKNLYSHNDGQTYKYMKEELSKIGYFVKEKVMNTAEYGNIPQNRERLYIVGFRNKKDYDAFEFPKKKDLKTTIDDIKEAHKVDKKYYYTDKTPFYKMLLESVVDTHTFYQWRRKYVRANKSGLCPTLTANMGTGGHNVPIIKDTYGIRKLTPRECFRLQGFSDNYKLPSIADSHLYKQIGNSVSIPVIKSIVENMITALQ